MKQDPFNRLFPSDLSDQTVESLFEFLLQLTDTFNEIYADQIRCLMERQLIDTPEPPDILADPFDDEIPF